MALYDLTNRIRAFGEKRRLNVGTAAKPRWIDNVHAGDDYAATYGQDKVLAACPGVVSYVGWSSTYGNQVHVRQPSGAVIRYHSLAGQSALKVGEKVTAGVTLIGLTGRTASGASGNHVHVQAEINGKPVDPRPYIAGAAFGGLTDSTSTPLENDDMTPEEFLNTAFEVVPGKPDSRRTVAQALRAIFTETQATIQRVDTARSQITDVATAVWGHPLKHPLANRSVSAGDLLRYEPAEHENTRRAVALVASGDVDAEEIAKEIAAKFPGLDPTAYAVAAADEADRRDRERLGK